ncbi:MAG: hypothetical protein PHR81_09570 [Bacteroidales bacterium]|nr:hypothetical protein [Bacteroidales bacterium]
MSVGSGGAVFMDRSGLLINFTVSWTGKYFYHRRRPATLVR